MRIAICDDESFFRKEIKEMLLTYKNEKKIRIDIYEFDTGDELLKSEKIFDIILMDYIMPGSNGLDTARKLRLKNNICSIIFVTANPDFIFDSFEVQPFRFLIKPVSEDKLFHAIDDYLHQQKILNPIVISEDGEQKVIRSEDILYLEGDGKYCRIITEKNTYKSCKTLSRIHALLPEFCFIRIHKSFVVNMYNIASVGTMETVLQNGTKLPVSRKYASTFKKTFLNFIKNYYAAL